MRKNVIAILFIILSLNSVFSQINDVNSYSRLHLQHNEYNSIIGVNADVYTGSNSINNNFTNSFLTNSFIDNELKQSVNLHDKNYFGYKNQTNIYFSTLCDTLLGVANMGYKVSVNNYSIQNMQFSRDFFNLAMHGNKMYEGKTADISGLDINYLTFQSIEFGLFKRFVEPTNGYHTLYLGLSFIKGQNYHYFFLENGSMYTAPDGEFIDLEMKGTYFGSDSVKANLSTVSGLGASLNFYWAYEDVKHKTRYEVSFTELGLISWYDNPLNYNADTTIKFEGVEVNNVLNSTQKTYDEVSQDSVINTVFNKQDNTTFNKSLPKQFSFSVTKIMLEQKYELTIGTGYIFNANQFMPAFYANNRFVLDPNFNISLLVAYGGYSNFNLGLGTSFRIKKRLRGYIGTTNILGFVLPKKTYSQAAYISLAYSFGKK